MSVRVIKHVGVGHPWDGRPGFDGLELMADTMEELKAAAVEAERKFWQPWLLGVAEDGQPAGVLYKPTGATMPWYDGPDRPHPGFIEELATVAQ